VAVQLGLDVAYPGENTFVFDTHAGESRAWEFGEPPPEASPEHPEGWFGSHRGNYFPGLVSVSPDGLRLLMTGEIRDARTGKVVAKIPPTVGGNAHSFGPDGRAVFVGGPTGFTLWHPDANRVLETFRHLPGKTGALSHEAAFSVTPSGDSVMVYSTRDAAPLARVNFGGQVHAATFSEDGKKIVAVGQDSGLREQLWRPEDLIKVAAHFVTRDLDKREVGTYLAGEPHQELIPTGRGAR
jgi:hypothetical protein